MAWVDQKLHWKWVEDRKKGVNGLFIGEIPPPPSNKRIDYVTIAKGVVGYEHNLAIGVWDDDIYTPVNRNDLEFHTRQYTFDPTVKGAVLVQRPRGEAKYDASSQAWSLIPSE